MTLPKIKHQANRQNVVTRPILSSAQKDNQYTSQPQADPFKLFRKAECNPLTILPSEIGQLQRTVGNQSLGQLLANADSQSVVQRRAHDSLEEAKQQPIDRQQARMKFFQRVAPRQSGTHIQAKRQENYKQSGALTVNQDIFFRQEAVGSARQRQGSHPNNTGLPNKLKAGVEQLSGVSLNDVQVYYNSDKPAQLQAHAYAQGTDIHLAPGQEQQLPHEAWHIVQQKQGRVAPTLQMKGIVINDESELEKEADIMGTKAQQMAHPNDQSITYDLGEADNRSTPKVLQANWKDKIREVGKTSLAHKRGEVVKSKLGATMARRGDRKDLIPAPEEYLEPEQIKTHLGKFSQGAHAFITPEINKNIKGDWGWGLDKNFVAPLPEAETLLNEAQSQKGIFTIEEKLGIPHLESWSWANKEKNPANKLWRYIIPKPDNFNIAMPSGQESRAYKDEWVAGGETLGGANEAVIDKIPRIQLLLAIAKGDVITEEVQLPKTERYFEEFRQKKGQN